MTPVRSDRFSENFIFKILVFIGPNALRIKYCPPIAPHSNEQSPESQDCIYVPQRGPDGCVQSYSLVCPQKPVKILEITTKMPEIVENEHKLSPIEDNVQKISSNGQKLMLATEKCPKIKPPVNKTAAGCVYAENYDKKGCVISYDMICSTPLSESKPSSKSVSNSKPLQRLKNNYRTGVVDWRWMLGDSYRGVALKDARKFRPRSSLAVPSSGRFVACKRQSDCFMFREPKEWCGNGWNNTLYAWT